MENCLTIEEKRQLVNPDDEESSVSSQCKILSLARSTYYYKKNQIDKLTLLLMALIDRIHIAQPTYGSRRITAQINAELVQNGINKKVNRKRIQRLMQEMNIEAIYQKPNLSKLYHAEYVRPYLLKNLKITHPNQVWASDITYIPFNGGFIYLYAIIDIYSRTIVGWGLSETLKNNFVIDTIKEAIKTHGTPDIMNSDQGSHFTSKEYIELLEEKKIKISMDGKARALDNIFIERFWRTIKYEYLFLNDFSNPYELEKGIYNYMHFYNNYRLHQNLNYKPPMSIYNLSLHKKNTLIENTFDPNIPEYNLNKDVKKIIDNFKDINENQSTSNTKKINELKQMKADIIKAGNNSKQKAHEKKLRKIFRD